MKTVWYGYWEMIHEIANAIHSLVYYVSAKVYFAEQKHLGKVLAK